MRSRRKRKVEKSKEKRGGGRESEETNIPLPPSTASQTFLRMEQPLSELSYSKSASLEIGTTYLLPFEFVMPTKIPQNVCRHSYRHKQVHSEHCQLPPSMDQRSIWQFKDQIVDYLAPDGINITYSICLRVFESCHKTGIIRTVAEWRHPVHTRSSQKERAPLLTPGESRYYCLNREKKLIGGWRPRALGTFFVKAAQPAAIQSHRESGLPATAIAVNLQYTTAAQITSQELQSIHPRLDILTFSSLEPWPDFPNAIDSSICPYHNGLNIRTVPLQPSQFGPINWQTSVLEKDLSEDSTTYTASLQIPVIFPDDTDISRPFFPVLCANILGEVIIFVSCRGSMGQDVQDQ